MIGDDIAAALPEMRAMAESLMTDECAITRAGVGVGTYDPVTNQVTPPPPILVYSGKCRIQRQQITSDTPTVAADVLVVAQHIVSIPVGSASVELEDRIEITGSASDSANIGRRFTARSPLHKSQATALRIQCEEVER